MAVLCGLLAADGHFQAETGLIAYYKNDRACLDLYHKVWKLLFPGLPVEETQDSPNCRKIAASSSAFNAVVL